ncbi:hypothetical protein GGX14DRAFT_553910 [Mycena pura]|uniref:Uncharacterized protein n=1 Tax=Mycena pura TaxID=153505 RepID=A0AAD6YVA3_9AGAR|nr:hypothetical protein GGX14DRAFT_553910 [Mycena pura]
MEDGVQEEEGAGMGTPAALHQVQAHAHTPMHTYGTRSRGASPRAPPPMPVMDGFDGLAYAAGTLYDLEWGLFNTDVIPADHLCLTHARDEVGAGGARIQASVESCTAYPRLARRSHRASSSVASLAGRRLTGSAG